MPVEPRFNLVIIHTPGSQQLSDWISVKERIAARATDIEVRIVNNVIRDEAAERWQVTRPSLVFSPLHLYDYRPPGGKVYVGRQLDKLSEVRRLAKAKLPVPRSARLLPDLDLDPALWGDFVIAKPLDEGSHGDNLRLVETRRVGALYAELTDGRKRRMMVQQYIDQVDELGRPFQYRVLTMFGRPILSALHGWRDTRPPLAAVASDPKGRIAVNTRGADREWQLTIDEDVLALARLVADAIPEIPCLGIDILRDKPTGRLYVLETNAGGNTWHFSSQVGMRFKPETREKLYAQFNMLDTVAELLIERTRQEAR